MSTHANGAPVQLPFTVVEMQPDERLKLKLSGFDPDTMVVIACPTVQAPTPAMMAPGQIAGMRMIGPDGKEHTAMVFLLAVAIPIEAPALARGILGADGRPVGSIQLQAPVGADCRVMVPKAHLTAAVKATLADAAPVSDPATV